VGRWPAFSCASRAALSPASCVAFSFDVNVPELVLGDAAVVAVLDGVAALTPSGPAIMAPITPPVSSEPATPAPRINRCIWFIFHLLDWQWSQHEGDRLSKP
jgi:hypothetical protein